MQKRLTLNLEESLIKFAHLITYEKRKSISQIVAEYFKSLQKREKLHLSEEIQELYGVFTKDSQPKFTHRLTYLTEATGLEELLSDEQKLFIDELEPLNIEARYPTYKDKLLKKLNLEKCRNVLENTEEFIRWIKIKLLIL